ncbi:unnamed protein product [Lathyrus sativus]|nr:unnamed protein product [Lathyrus sativus]
MQQQGSLQYWILVSSTDALRSFVADGVKLHALANDERYLDIKQQRNLVLVYREFAILMYFSWHEYFTGVAAFFRGGAQRIKSRKVWLSGGVKRVMNMIGCHG